MPVGAMGSATIFAALKRGGRMSFTKKEAEAKLGKRVRVRTEGLAKWGIPQGTLGRVIAAQPKKQQQGGTAPVPQRPAKKKDKEDRRRTARGRAGKRDGARA